MVNDKEKKKSMVQTTRFRKCTLECKYFMVLIIVMNIISLKRRSNQIYLGFQLEKEKPNMTLLNAI